MTKGRLPISRTLAKDLEVLKKMRQEREVSQFGASNQDAENEVYSTSSSTQGSVRNEITLSSIPENISSFGLPRERR